jgi:hypothetical protein
MLLSEKHVSSFLQDNDIQGEILQLSDHVSTVETAAQALGVSPESIVRR